MQYFINPADSKKVFAFWQAERMKWYQDLGISKDNLRFRIHADDERAHYAKQAIDIEYKFEFTDDSDGFKEMEGIHDRGDWDLSRHQQFSKTKLAVKDDSNVEFIPNIIEASGGVDRATLAFLIEAYQEVQGGRSTTTEAIKEAEVVLRLDKRLSPIKIAILPLSKKPELQAVTQKIVDSLRLKYRVQYDDTGSIGKRYRRQDEIGTPYCLTIDFDSLEDKKVTVRDRDTMEQDRVGVDQLDKYFSEKFNC